jgi:hypothetical protein
MKDLGLGSPFSREYLTVRVEFTIPSFPPPFGMLPQKICVCTTTNTNSTDTKEGKFVQCSIYF